MMFDEGEETEANVFEDPFTLEIMVGFPSFLLHLSNFRVMVAAINLSTLIILGQCCDDSLWPFF